MALGRHDRRRRLRAGRHDPGGGPPGRRHRRGPAGAHPRPRAPPADGRGRHQPRRVPHHLRISTAVSGVGTPETAVEIARRGSDWWGGRRLRLPGIRRRRAGRARRAAVADRRHPRHARGGDREHRAPAAVDAVDRRRARRRSSSAVRSSPAGRRCGTPATASTACSWATRWSAAAACTPRIGAGGLEIGYWVRVGPHGAGLRHRGVPPADRHRLRRPGDRPGRDPPRRHQRGQQPRPRQARLRPRRRPAPPAGRPVRDRRRPRLAHDARRVARTLRIVSLSPVRHGTDTAPSRRRHRPRRRRRRPDLRGAVGSCHLGNRAH